MSWLNGLPGGSVVGKLESVSSREERGSDEVTDLIFQGLLPAQKEFCEDFETKILGFVAGFGAGKTRALCAKAVLMCIQHAETPTPKYLHEQLGDLKITKMR